MQPFWRSEYRIGVLGGGQLGRMLLPPAQRLNLKLHILDPDPQAPCATATANFQVGDLQNSDTVFEFGRNLNLVTIEIEKVSVAGLRRLSEAGVLVRPGPQLIELAQDKLTQKEFFKKQGLPTADFVCIDDVADLDKYKTWFPAVLKLRRDEYDGRGVMMIDASTNIPQAIRAPAILEKKINFIKELSIVVSRDSQGRVASYPAVEQEFHPDANLVEFLFSPAEISSEIETRAQQLACDLAEALGLEGLMAVELFLTAEGKLWINEIAPRPHNSGHHFIEASQTSQFEQHLRAILDIPPGDTSLRTPAAMINLLGAQGHTGPANYLGLEKALALPGVHLHLYGKATTRPFRKMGHLTVMAANLEATKYLARQIRNIIRVEARTNTK